MDTRPQFLTHLVKIDISRSFSTSTSWWWRETFLKRYEILFSYGEPFDSHKPYWRRLSIIFQSHRGSCSWHSGVGCHSQEMVQLPWGGDRQWGHSQLETFWCQNFKIHLVSIPCFLVLHPNSLYDTAKGRDRSPSQHGKTGLVWINFSLKHLLWQH